MDDSVKEAEVVEGETGIAYLLRVHVGMMDAAREYMEAAQLYAFGPRGDGWPPYIGGKGDAETRMKAAYEALKLALED